MLSASADEIATLRKSQSEISATVARDLQATSALRADVQTMHFDHGSKIDRLESMIRSSDATEKRSKILEWVCSTADPSVSYANAIRTRQQGTGLWFLESKQFSDWVRSPGFLWLYGNRK